MPSHRYGKSAAEIEPLYSAKQHSEMLLDFDLIDAMTRKSPMDRAALLVALNNTICKKEQQRQSCFGRCATLEDLGGAIARLVKKGTISRRGLPFRRVYFLAKNA